MIKQGLYLPEFERDNCGAGFICNLKGAKSNEIIHDALEILIKLEHRGAVSSDGKTGDGAGILIDIPHEFFVKNTSFKLPEAREYAVGMTFLPQSDNQLNYCKKVLEDEVKKQGLEVLGWRKVPVNKAHLGYVASKIEPAIEQIFIGKNGKELNEHQFNAKLFTARKISEHTIVNSKLSDRNKFYFPLVLKKWS